MSDIVKAHDSPSNAANPIDAIDAFGSTVADILRGGTQADALAVFCSADLSLERCDEADRIAARRGEALQLRVRVAPHLYGTLGDRRARLQQTILEAAQAVVSASLEERYLARVLISPAISHDPDWRAKSQAFLEEVRATRASARSDRGDRSARR